MYKKIGIFWWIVVVVVIVSSVVAAETPTRIISNSQDWRDVYSVMLYGNLAQIAPSFLVSDKHATLILNSIPKENHIWAISSKKIPQAIGYRSILESRGYSAEEYVYENVNLELAKTLTDVTKFIILDDSYGYNAIAVAPYAVATNSYVLFADKSTISDVEAFLDSRKIEQVVIFGNVDREVKNRLEKYNPEIINKNGDRFLNNIEIVKKYQELRHAKQVILTNGEFIEQELMSGKEPVLFIGSSNVPDSIREYIQSSEIEIGVLIGNELVGTATTIRRQVGISVFVKFAQGARAPQSAISQVEALDMFYMPTYALNLEIQSATYNKATNQLEITLKNAVEQAIYFKGTYSVNGPDGSSQTVGDLEPVFIDGGGIKTMNYTLDAIPDGQITGNIFIIFGESPAALEKELRTTITIEAVRLLDECEIRINRISVHIPKKIFYIAVENPGTTDCYADAELIDLVIAGARRNVGQPAPVIVSAGNKKDLRIKVDDFEQEDVEDNEHIKVRVYYGQRENALVKTIEGTLDVAVKKGDMIFYVLLGVIVLMLALILKKRKKKQGPNH